MNNYLAKSHPRETIQVHTDNLLRNFDILQSTYPNLKIDWDMLYLSCLYHDFGKMNQKFQYKIENQTKVEGEIPHGILSLAFLNIKSLKKKGFKNDDIKVLAHAIAYHHDRDLNYTNDELEQEVEEMKRELDGFKYDKVDELLVKKLGAKFFRKNRIYEKENPELFFKYTLVKGLLNRLDYAASGYIEVERPNNFLEKSLDNLMKKWKQLTPSSNWNELQKHMLLNKENNIIAIAETGMGKTESGLLWIGDNKGFFTLPLKTAINAMYSRITNDIVEEDFQEKVGLLHSDTYREYLYNDKQQGDIDDYYNKTKQLSLPLTICTLDQIFDFVYRYRGFESKLATLAYSKVVIDEVQMYSSDLLAYLIVGLSYITKVGGKFAILTATLPSIVEDLLKDEGVEFMPSKTFTNDYRIRHSVKVVNEQLNTDYIVNLYNNNKILVICNTVKEAQRVYSELKIEHRIDNINLFHSNFIKKDRKNKEDKILKIGDRDCNEYGIWVTTQVVEASLDIDFDILVTELSDLNGLFQRMGRCYRGRIFDKEGYNCFVFDGGKKLCTGIGFVIDKDIFKLSKEALKSIGGPMKEKDKMDMVKQIYSTEKLKNTEYYKLIKKNIDYVKSIEDYEKSKSEIKKIFRNINTSTVIPKPVYDDNYEEIQSYIKVLARSYKHTLSEEERQSLKREKATVRSQLMEFTVSVPYYKAHDNIYESIEVSKYESLDILDCNYSEETGVDYKELKVDKTDTSDNLHNFF
ncbi:MAG: CRISPR-associated helicase Cas3' [Firmicutes bacterium]|nr:CRISPR-associated helicase Cas3' [Bacillota bacterium]